ncbi:hypothetical protein ACIA98_17060 [Streptomyces sp. NPDC051366]
MVFAGSTRRVRVSAKEGPRSRSAKAMLPPLPWWPKAVGTPSTAGMDRK